ncbi:unnamed protein product [Rhodiola kirilowii]
MQFPPPTTFKLNTVQCTLAKRFPLPCYRLPIKEKQLTAVCQNQKDGHRVVSIGNSGPSKQFRASSLDNGRYYESFENDLVIQVCIEFIDVIFSLLKVYNFNRTYLERIDSNSAQLGTVFISCKVVTKFCCNFQNKIQEIMPYMGGRCIYLVGMMGSGKTTVGRILSDVLEYSFCDSDKMVEQAIGASVSEIFKLYGEGHFRDKESEELENLSTMKRLVVSTGGGAVVRRINWINMQKGITVWIDVPLEALARRIAAVGTESRPLLHIESGDAYTKALLRLNSLLKERGHAYANAHTRVSLDDIAAKLGHTDVFNLSPAAIAFEVLEKIDEYIKMEPPRHSM